MQCNECSACNETSSERPHQDRIVNADESHYLHGTSLEEQRRLAKLNELINAKSLREIALRSGETVLDVGSGLGQLTRDMARQTGAKAVGVERSVEQLRECLRFAQEAG